MPNRTPTSDPSRMPAYLLVTEQDHDRIDAALDREAPWRRQMILSSVRVFLAWLRAGVPGARVRFVGQPPRN